MMAAVDKDSGGGPCVLKKYSTCQAGERERVLRCERAGCPKFAHRSCSLKLTESFRDAAAAEPFRVVCGKRCFNALSKGRGGVPLKHDATPLERKKRSPWNSDGPSETVSSLAVLLAWLREPKNYARWVNGGDESKFETKAAIAAQILARIKAEGVETDRNPNDVFAKIYQLEKSFAEASEWLRENENSANPAQLVAGAKKRCAYYYDLVDSMGAEYSKGSSSKDSNGASSTAARKRSAAADANNSDATKRRMVGASGRELRSKNADNGNKAAASLHAAVLARIAAAGASTNEPSATPEKASVSTAIMPVLMNHSFLKATGSSTLAPKKPSAAHSVQSAHIAALNASIMLANSIAASNTPPSKPLATMTTPTTATTALAPAAPRTPADAAMATLNGSLRQSATRAKPALLGTTAAELAEMTAAKARQSAAKTSSSAATATTNSNSSNSSSSTSSSVVTVPSPGASVQPMGFSASMLQVNNSMLQATAEKLQAEAKIATITANTALLRARKTLRDEGIPQAEIDAVLPLTRH